MSKKHFILLAKTLRNAKAFMPREAFLAHMNAVADVCAATNPSFNRSKFISAILED